MTHTLGWVIYLDMTKRQKQDAVDTIVKWIRAGNGDICRQAAYDHLNNVLIYGRDKAEEMMVESIEENIEKILSPNK